ncbi:phosphotransferase [Nocardia sp. NPDC057663]|uniref:phosphotransferase n=1 Tax=Nocardia sp. NPDC057663 TaxID=3346201 RepID=UPI00366B452A
MTPAVRTVRAVVTHGERILGEAPAFTTPESSAWYDTLPVCRRLTAILGVPTVVLRLLSVQRDHDDGACGGIVTYHAEALECPAAALEPAAVNEAELFDQHPLRSPWAISATLRDALAWACETVGATGQPEQVKSWNLAAVFRIPTADGPVWLKGLPAFAQTEPDTVTWLADPTLTARVIARRPGWMISTHLPGTHCRTIRPDLLDRLVRRWAEAVHHRPVPAFLPDRTPATLRTTTAELLEGDAGSQLSPADLQAAHSYLDRLPSLIGDLESCGLPTTVVHGDFTPDNCRVAGDQLSILDFADAHHGHPAIDGFRPAIFLSADLTRRSRAAWIDAWRHAIPDSDPHRALLCAEPLMRLSYAHRYQEFLDGIEPSERIYHEGDPAGEIRKAIAYANRR